MSFSTSTSLLMDAYIWRILLIEDDEDDYIIARGMLANARQGKFTLEWASSYEEGRQTLQEDRTFDAVLVDYYLGAGKGTDLIRETLADDYPAPILLLTGRGTYEMDVEAMESGAADFLSKSEINAVLLERALRYAIERKKNEVALNRSQAELRETTEHLSVALKAVNFGVWSVNLQGDEFYADVVARRMHGFSPDEPLANRTFANRSLHPDDLQNNDAVFQRAAQTGVFDTEYRVVLPSGEVCWIYSFGALDEDRSHLHGVVMDITERKNIEQTMRESEEKFARAFHSSPTGLIITRMEDGFIIDANQAFLQMVGHTREEVLGHSTVELGLHQSVEKRAAVLQQILEQGGVRNMEIQARTRTGKALQLLYSAEVVEINRMRCLLTTCLDITPIRQMEAERIVAAAEMEVQRRLLEQREKERQGIARELHDGPIQTLASTTFQMHLIKQTFPDPALQEAINQVATNIKITIRELRDMLNDLRPPALMHFGLSKVIQMYNADFKERHPELEISMEIDETGHRLPDQTGLALFRIYQEGLNNVIRHSGANRVHVLLSLRKDRFNLEMRDNGRGFSTASDLSRLTREGHFGLAGMKERAEAAGGELVVSSAPGEGTVIQVRGKVPQKEVT